MCPDKSFSPAESCDRDQHRAGLRPVDKNDVSRRSYWNTIVIAFGQYRELDLFKKGKRVLLEVRYTWILHGGAKVDIVRTEMHSFTTIKIELVS